MPKKKNGEKNLSKTLTGDDLLGFVRGELFPYLRAFKSSEASPDTLQYKIGEIFSGIQCKLTSGYVMRDVFDEVDNLRFQSSEDQHEMSSLYEIRISRMGNAGRNGGEYYTPRPLIRSIIAVLDLPQKVFTAGVKTVVLFFEKGHPTKKTWFYQLNLDRTLGKTNPLTEDDLAEFRTLFKKRADSANSWTVNIADLDPDTLDLTVRNPNAKEEKVMRAPKEIAAEMAKLDQSNAALLADILKALG